MTYYAQVPPAQRDGLNQFRETYPPKSAVGWTYHVLGAADKPPLLWLVGGIKVADVSYDKLMQMADEFHIITPNYPPLTTMSALADGLASLLDAENIPNAHVLGGSFGGMLAQEFIARHPHRVQRIVLSTTTAPNPKLAQSYHKQARSVRFVPAWLMRRIAAKRMYDIIAPPQAEAEFYRAYLNELYMERLNKADILSTYQAMVDFHLRDAVPQWAGDDMLIIASADDHTFGANAHEALAARYPHARLHLFSAAGHSPSSTQSEQFFQLVRDFLQQ